MRMKKVLVVDDSTTVRRQVATALDVTEFEVLEAGDGQEALIVMRQISDLSLVICDVNMPLLGGLELLESIRRETTLRVPPIVMLTSEGQPDMITRAKQAGAKGWLVKPFKPEHLLAVARKLTKLT
jgi:two-component system chemotaxis response regulator CheY